MEDVSRPLRLASMSWGEKYRAGLRFGVGNSIGMNALLYYIQRIIDFQNRLSCKEDYPLLSLKEISFLDAGCGPGRDLFSRDRETGLLTAAFKYAVGVDPEVDSTVLYTDQNIRRLMQSGEISVYIGNLLSMLTPRANDLFDAALMNRVVHLMDQAERDKNFSKLFEVVRGGGIVSVAARSPQDFKPDTMRRVKNGRGEVVFRNGDRKGEKMWLLTADQLGDELLRAGFKVVETYEGREPENNRNPDVTTHCAGVIAVKPPS